VLPIICALIAALLTSLLRRRPGPWTDRVGWEGALLLVSVVVCHVALVGWPGFPPTDVKFWPLFIALAGVPLAAMGTAIGRWPVRLAVQVIVIGAGSALLLRPELQSLSVAGCALMLAIVMAAWLATAWVWSLSASSATPGASMTALLVTTGATAIAVLLFGTFTYAQVVGIGAIALAVLALMHWWGGMPRIGASSVALATAVLLPMWWLLGATMADLPRWAPVLFIAAGASSWISVLPVISRLSGWKRIACVALVAITIVSPVLVVGIVASMHQSASSGGGDGY
jgi:hypothetical protein